MRSPIKLILTIGDTSLKGFFTDGAFKVVYHKCDGKTKMHFFFIEVFVLHLEAVPHRYMLLQMIRILDSNISSIYGDKMDFTRAKCENAAID